MIDESSIYINNDLETPYLESEGLIELIAVGLIGSSAFFHHTISRDNGMTYGGLHESEAAAEKVRQQLAVDWANASVKGEQVYSDDEAVGRGFIEAIRTSIREDELSSTQVIELAEAEAYNPWGGVARKKQTGVHGNIVHGLNDGTHSDESNKDNIFFLQNGGVMAIPWTNR